MDLSFVNDTLTTASTGGIDLKRHLSLKHYPRSEIYSVNIYFQEQSYINVCARVHDGSVGRDVNYIALITEAEFR